MKQYWELKSQVPGALLFFRMGDFYELFGDDAKEAAKILGITLTTREKNKPDPTPMAGVPHHSASSYVMKALKAGWKVAIGEQVEDPASVKGKTIVKREIVRVLTPAVYFDQESIDQTFLVTILPVKTDSWIMAFFDPSTGETKVTLPLDNEQLIQSLSDPNIRHLLLTDEVREKLKRPLGVYSENPPLIETIPSNYLREEQAIALLKEQYKISELLPFFHSHTAIHALGILIKYTLHTQKQEHITHLRVPEPIRPDKFMSLGQRAAWHLDILPQKFGNPNLFDLINKTQSAPGSRELKRWLLEPLRDVVDIKIRQNAVKALAQNSKETHDLTNYIKELYDLERICGRINAGVVTPSDTFALGKSLAPIKSINETLCSLAKKEPFFEKILEKLRANEGVLALLASEILNTQKEPPPLITREGGIFKPETSEELARLISLSENGERWLLNLELKERELTGIQKLKVRYNRVFGYFIEITKSHAHKVPTHYHRKQTMVGAERFFTEELKKFEEEMLSSTSKQKSLEMELFEALVQKLKNNVGKIMETTKILAKLDVLLSLAKLSENSAWSFPEVDNSMEIEIKSGRHPLVDVVKNEGFVPNDLIIDGVKTHTLIITGPNMGGKSTIMRQIALIIILGQIGAPVPAISARWGSVSSVFTRIGAHDAISQGQSTFMVEMSELASILHSADSRSLIILDEIGRGTATYDGMSVAWATLEWITKNIKARTLFATHYHELTKLEGRLVGLANAHMAVENAKTLTQDALRFLYELRSGAANESFGIQVAKMAGLPNSVIKRAWEVLDDLENAGALGKMKNSSTHEQLALFESMNESKASLEHWDISQKLKNSITEETDLKYANLIKKIEKLNPDQITPIEALKYIYELKSDIKHSQDFTTNEHIPE